jgi:hypothetical protein
MPTKLSSRNANSFICDQRIDVAKLTAHSSQYASDGELQFTLPGVLKVRPISDHGNVNEIIGKFGGCRPTPQGCPTICKFSWHFLTGI